MHYLLQVRKTHPTNLDQTDDTMMDWVLVLVTGAIAYHGLTFRDKNGDTEFGHLLFGCIALLFFVRFLFEDLLGWVQF